MKKHYFWTGLSLFLSAVIIVFLIFLLPSYEKEIYQFAIAHPVLAPVIIILWRILAMIIPPIPGGIISFAFIPIIGWFLSYLYAFIGTTAGAIIAFYLARTFREPLVAKFVTLQHLRKLEKKLSYNTEFIAFFIIRMTTGPIMDFVSYVAGLSKLSFKTFLLATIISELPSAVTYYMGDKIYDSFMKESSSILAITFLFILIIALFLASKLKFFKNLKI